MNICLCMYVHVFVSATKHKKQKWKTLHTFTCVVSTKKSKTE